MCVWTKGPFRYALVMKWNGHFGIDFGHVQNRPCCAMRNSCQMTMICVLFWDLDIFASRQDEKDYLTHCWWFRPISSPLIFFGCCWSLEIHEQFFIIFQTFSFLIWNSELMCCHQANYLGKYPHIFFINTRFQLVTSLSISRCLWHWKFILLY